MDAIDPIIMLKNAFSQGHEPKVEADEVVFKNGTRLNKALKTRLEKKTASSEEYYTVYDIWFCVMNRNMTPANYGLACNSQKVNVIGAALRKRVCNYFMGEEEEIVLKDALKPITSDIAGVGKDEEMGMSKGADSNGSLMNLMVPNEVLDKVLNSCTTLCDYNSMLVTYGREYKELQQHAKSLFPDQTKNFNVQHDRYQPQEEEEYYKSRFGDMNIHGIDTRGSFVSKPLTSESSKSSSSLSGTKNHTRPKLAKNEEVKLSKPIIVIPGVVSSLINRYNMRDFFENSTFVDTRKMNLDFQVPHTIDVVRTKSDNESSIYQVIDNTLRMDKKDWERVVAVFVMGEKWQLSRYPLGDDAAKFFRRYCGFHLKYENDEIPQETISQWNVNVINISRYERHTDKTVLMQFWNKLDKFALQSKWTHLKM